MRCWAILLQSRPTMSISFCIGNYNIESMNINITTSFYYYHPTLLKAHPQLWQHCSVSTGRSTNGRNHSYLSCSFAKRRTCLYLAVYLTDSFDYLRVWIAIASNLQMVKLVGWFLNINRFHWSWGSSGYFFMKKEDVGPLNFNLYLWERLILCTTDVNFWERKTTLKLGYESRICVSISGCCEILLLWAEGFPDFLAELQQYTLSSQRTLLIYLWNRTLWLIFHRIFFDTILKFQAFEAIWRLLHGSIFPSTFRPSQVVIFFTVSHFRCLMIE